MDDPDLPFHVAGESSDSRRRMLRIHISVMITTASKTTIAGLRHPNTSLRERHRAELVERIAASLERMFDVRWKGDEHPDAFDPARSSQLVRRPPLLN